jgi:hypothetical protein
MLNRYVVKERVILGALILAACGTSSHDGATGGDDAGEPTDGTVGDGAGPPADSAVDDVYVPPVDAAAWDGGFGAPLSCATPGAFKQNWSQQCGYERWPVKTGTDNGASGVSLLPQPTTIAELSAIPMPSSFPQSSRVAPAEKTIYALKDVKLIFARLEGDSDYHLVVSDGTRSMITEIPYPGGCTNGSAWQCEISRARAAVDARLSLVLNQAASRTSSCRSSAWASGIQSMASTAWPRTTSSSTPSSPSASARAAIRPRTKRRARSTPHSLARLD